METAAAAAAKLLQSCPTLSDLMDCSLFIIKQTKGNTEETEAMTQLECKLLGQQKKTQLSSGKQKRGEKLKLE